MAESRLCLLLRGCCNRAGRDRDFCLRSSSFNNPSPSWEILNPEALTGTVKESIAVPTEAEVKGQWASEEERVWGDGSVSKSPKVKNKALSSNPLGSM